MTSELTATASRMAARLDLGPRRFRWLSFFSVMASSAGVYMAPLALEFGWNSTETSSGVSIAGLVTAALSPFFGILIDKWGTRRIALPGLILTSLLTAMFSLNTGSAVARCSPSKRAMHQTLHSDALDLILQGIKRFGRETWRGTMTKFKALLAAAGVCVAALASQVGGRRREPFCRCRQPHSPA